MQNFAKNERLCSKSVIDQLFTQGHSFFKHPLKIKWLQGQWDSNNSVKVVISVSKHRFKKAVDRNKIKRLIRESFRLNKFVLENGLKGQKVYLAIIYTSNEIPDFTTLNRVINDVFHRLNLDYEKLSG